MGFTPEQLRELAAEARRKMSRGEPVNDPALSEPEGPVMRPELLDRDPDELEAAKARAKDETERVRREAEKKASGEPGARRPQLREVESPQPAAPSRDMDGAADALAGGRSCLICRGPLTTGCPVCQVCIDDKKRGDAGYGG